MKKFPCIWKGKKGHISFQDGYVIFETPDQKKIVSTEDFVKECLSGDAEFPDFKNTDKKACECCGRILKPAEAFADGEPTTVGLIPCACNKPLMTDSGVVFPGTEKHQKLIETGRYSINDILTPVR